MVIINKLRLKKIIDSAKRSGKSVLIKKGVFDIIHPGHISIIDTFKKHADIVIIMAQSDKFTKKKKGGDRPINNQKQRGMVIDGLKNVDYTYLDKSNSRKEYLKLLEYLKPTILAIIPENKQKTKDYSSPFWKLKEFPDKKNRAYSTTKIINKILNLWK